MKKNITIKVLKACNGIYWTFNIYEGGKELMRNRPSNHSSRFWEGKAAAICNAKAMAKRIGIKFDPEIIKQHGC